MRESLLNISYPLACLLFLAWCLPLSLLSQQKAAAKLIISGKLLDSVSRKPIPFVSMIVLDENGGEAAAGYSSEEGLFKAPVARPGRYSIAFSAAGYSGKEITVAVTETGAVLDLVWLSPNYGSLEEVAVVSRKKIIEQRPGMLVYHAENDVTNKGGSAADVLRKAPVLNVDAQGNVTMRGSSNLKILVNGKYSGQMARSAADALNMMPADIIKSVEVITTPSAKYDAEGAAGVINIITKKGSKNFSGSLEASVSHLQEVFNPRFSAANDRLNVAVNGHLHRLGTKSSSTLERTSLNNGAPSGKLEQHTRASNRAPHGSGDITVSYMLDSVSELDLGINAWFGKWPDNNELTSRVSLANGSVSEAYSQSTASRAVYLGGDFNIGYNRRLKRAGQQIALLAQYSPSSDKGRYHTIQTNDLKELLYLEGNRSVTTNREWTFQADYIQPLNRAGKIALESGLKVILREVDNEYKVEASNDQQPDLMEPQPSRSDRFAYEQNVLAAYSMLKINMRQNWYAEVGARLERTFLKGSFVSNLTGFSNRFLNFVPTATLSKKLNESQTFNLSYTRRLTRPYIWDLNPNADASDPKNIISGNPLLHPETADQVEFSYGYVASSSFFINGSLFWKQTSDAIVDFTTTDSSGISFTNKQNLAANRQYGLNASYSAGITDRFTVNGNVNVNYLDFQSEALRIVNEGWASQINLNATYKLPRRYAAQAFGEYNTREVILQGYKTYRWYYSFAAKKEFDKNKITVALSVVNPFNKFIPQTQVMRAPDFLSSRNDRIYDRALKLTLNWEFGRMFEQKEIKKISNDDVKSQGKG